jgi:hypothetical protein
MAKTKSVGQDPVVAQLGPTTQPETAAQPETVAQPDLVLIKARVLVDCEFGAPNDVVEIDVDMTEALATVVDTDPAAVEYAESLSRQ